MTIDQFVWIYEDADRGIALVRGRGVPDLLATAGIVSWRWSTAGKGWVVPMSQASDLAAMCDHTDVTYRIKAVNS